MRGLLAVPVFATLVLATLVLATLALLAGCSSLQRDNVEPPAPLQTIETTLDVRTAWGRTTSDGTRDLFLLLRPYLEDQRLYVAGVGGRVGAYDARDGSRLWRTETGLALSGGVGGGEGLIVVGASTGELVALDRETGAEQWRTRLSSEVLAVAGVQLGVVVARTNDGRVHGLSAVGGESRWEVGRSTPALSLRGASVPLLLGGVAIVGFDNGKVLAIETGSGRPRWETTIAVPSGRSELERMVDVDGAQAVFGETLYAVSFQGRMAAVETQQGRIRWARDFSSYAGLAADADTLFVSAADGSVLGIDRASGAALWKQDALLRRRLTAPRIVGDYVVVADFEGWLHFLARGDGRIVARRQVDAEGVLAPPLVDGERLYVLGEAGRLVALELRGRLERPRRTPPPPPPGSGWYDE
jgi:outer membrane protein assembly factor BamB